MTDTNRIADALDTASDYFDVLSKLGRVIDVEAGHRYLLHTGEKLLLVDWSEPSQSWDVEEIGEYIVDCQDADIAIQLRGERLVGYDRAEDDCFDWRHDSVSAYVAERARTNNWT